MRSQDKETRRSVMGSRDKETRTGKRPVARSKDKKTRTRQNTDDGKQGQNLKVDQDK